MLPWALFVACTVLALWLLHRPGGGFAPLPGSTRGDGAGVAEGATGRPAPERGIDIRRGTAHPHGATLLGFVVLSLGVTAPIIAQLDRMMLDSGAGADAFIGAWNLWWTWTAVEHGTNPYVCDWIYPPDGTSLALHTHAVTYGLLTLPLHWILDAMLGDGFAALFSIYNLIVVTSFALTGYFTYRLAFDESRHHAASVAAGLIVTLSAFHFANTVRLHVLGIEWFVLFLWRVNVWHREPTWKRSIALAIAFALLLGASLEYTAYAGIGVFVLFAVRWRRTLALFTALQATPSLRNVGVGAIGVLLVAVATLPFWSTLSMRLSRGPAGFDPRLAQHFSADLLDFFLLNPRHPLWGSGFADRTASWHAGDPGFGLALGWIPLALFAASVVLVFARRSQRIWSIGAVCFLVLALGPALHIGGTVHEGFPLPQKLLGDLIPVLAGSRTPIRYVAPALVFLATSVAVGLALWHRGARPTDAAPRTSSDSHATQAAPNRSWIFPGLSALIVFESLAVPLQMTAIEEPPAYRWIRERSAPAARVVDVGGSSEMGDSATRSGILHLPRISARDALLYQTLHQHPTADNVDTAIPLRNPNAHDIRRDPVFGYLSIELARPDAIGQLTPSDEANVRSALEEFFERWNIRWLVLLPGSPEHAENLGVLSLGPAERVGDRVVVDVGR